MTRWSPDSCDCCLEFEQTGQGVSKWLGSIKFCRLHNGLRGQAHLNAVLAHNRSFNHSGDKRTDSQMITDREAKRVEKSRIRSLP